MNDDTVQNCLGIIDRAAERARRGLSPVMGGGRTNSFYGTMVTRREPKRSRAIPQEVKTQMLALRREGRTYREVARMTGYGTASVKYVCQGAGMGSERFDRGVRRAA